VVFTGVFLIAPAIKQSSVSKKFVLSTLERAVGEYPS
jgi:hypothetical protein